MTEALRVYVVSAPSGEGKTTLNKMLVERHADVEMSVSVTTRPQRPGEVDGQDYQFVSEGEFRRRIEAGEMLEWAHVHGNLYGTSKNQLKEIDQRGHYALLEIDVQGWLQAKEKLRKATSIFILPPSAQSLWDRLHDRGTDSIETIKIRMRNAYHEIKKASDYDFFIVNDDLPTAYTELERIIIYKKKGKIDKVDGQRLCQGLAAEFENGDWRELL